MNSHWKMRAGWLALCLVAVPLAAAPPAPPPLEAYGDLPGIEDVAISPSGKGMAILGRVDGKRQLVVLDGEHKVRGMVPASDAKIRDIRWIGEEAVLLETSVTQNLDPIFTADKAELWGALVIPLDGAKPWLVFDKSQYIAKTITGDYGTRFLDGKWQGFFSGIEFAKTMAGPSIIGSKRALYAVDLNDNSTRRVAELTASGQRRTWLIDGSGQPAATFDISVTTGRWEISNRQGKTLASGANPTGGVNLCCFGKDGLSILYGLDDDTTGESDLFEVPLAGGSPTKVFDKIRITRLYIDKNNSRLLGYLDGSVTHRPIFFDTAKQTAMRKVMRAFPKLSVELRDWTPDFSHLLVRTSGNDDSGSWYSVDMVKLKADVVGSERPLIVAEKVGPISTLSYRASDGMELDGVLTLPPGREAKNLPVIMLPHGGPTSHDEAVFDWWAQAFASRGYAVFQPNFRGSTNRDDSFRRAGYGQWGRKMQTDISDGLAELARLGIADPKRACIMGASYGGYAALAGVTLQKGFYRCAVADAPVSDLADFYSTENRESGNARMTWRSLRESLGSPSTFAEVSPRKHAVQASAPIMLIHGKDDTVVPFKHSTAMADALKAAGKPYELVVMREEDHWLSRAATRKQMLEAAMRFVQQHNPAD
jgi:dipeptidyl aminopeptidase/acylaminoacyl peptidase